MRDACEEYGLVPIHPSQPKEAILRTGFDFNVFFSGLSLSGRLRTVGFALTCLSTSIYIKRAIKSLYLLRRWDVNNLINKLITSFISYDPERTVFTDFT